MKRYLILALSVLCLTCFTCLTSSARDSKNAPSQDELNKLQDPHAEFSRDMDKMGGAKSTTAKLKPSSYTAKIKSKAQPAKGQPDKMPRPEYER